ncbi:MAG TPA: DUF3333 domain-containing protein, partial [Chromatiaceae bacterium]|nr:DUF3333 domain-containing protein [Chromatiaceae bacterium]
MTKPKNAVIKRREIREAVAQSLEKRRRRDRMVKRLGMGAILLGLGFLVIMFASIIGLGHSASWQTRIQLEVLLDPAVIDAEGKRQRETLERADYAGLIKKALRERFPDVKKRKEKRKLYKLVSSGASYQLQAKVLEDPSLIGSRLKIWLIADDDADVWFKRPDSGISRLDERQIEWLRELKTENRLDSFFNLDFFRNGDSREPELAGIRGALMGSIYTILVTLGLSLPLGIAAAIYLEEFAPRNRITDFIEVNINNLAAVPSIVFGLLGLAVFINFFGLPRSAPLVGGLVLTLMTLPTIIIAGRAALKSVPPSIR